MNKNEAVSISVLAHTYQILLRRTFPKVIVVPDPDIADMDDGTLAVFGISEDRIDEYVDYTYDILPSLLKEASVPSVSLLLHSAEDTKAFYPEINELVEARHNELLLEEAIKSILTSTPQVRSRERPIKLDEANATEITQQAFPELELSLVGKKFKELPEYDMTSDYERDLAA